jgi:predicted RNA methylase
LTTQSEKLLAFNAPIDWRQTIKKTPGVQRLINLNVVIEDRWFDFYHNVDTSSQLHEEENRVWREDKVNFHYLPIRPKCVRRVLRHLPVDIRSEYTFIDYGSGKGRALLVAAGLGFRQLLGIELRKELHDRASKNFREYRNLAPCTMESINMDAAEYELPNEKLVLFFFNPFGSEVMATVIRKLGASLNRSFRDVWVVLHDPTPPDLFDETRELRLEVAKDGYRIYRSVSYQQQ